MKIALGLEYPLSLRGGVSVLVEALIAGLGGEHEIILVSPDSPESLAASPAAALVRKHLYWDPQKISRATSRELAKRIAATSAQLAHFHFGGNFGWGSRVPGQCPLPYLARLGVPVFSSVHLIVNLLDGYCGPEKPLWFKLALLPMAWTGKMDVLRHVEKEIAVSEHDHRLLRRWYWPLRKKLIQVYHSRITERSAAANPPPREGFILNVGHVAPRKGQLILAEAFARIAPRHRDWKLVLAGHFGDDKIEGQLRAIAQKSGLEERLILLGQRDDAIDWMQRAGIYVQPSLQEALGLALQEAMFHGCACLGTRAGGIPELITHEETGLLVPPADAAALAGQLERLIEQPDLRSSLGRRAAASIRERGMTAEAMSKRHLELYASTVRKT